MLPRRAGRIVAVASVAGLVGSGGGPAYTASKHGVVGLVRQLAITYAERGVTVNAVCPGAIPTALRANSTRILGAELDRSDSSDLSRLSDLMKSAQLRKAFPMNPRDCRDSVKDRLIFKNLQAGIRRRAGQRIASIGMPVVKRVHPVMASERGFHASVDIHRMDVPERVNPKTWEIVCRTKKVYRIEVRYQPADIRRAH